MHKDGTEARASSPRPRDVVKRAIEFRDPPWVPYSIAFAPDQLRGRYSAEEIAAFEESMRAVGAVEVDRGPGRGTRFEAQQLFVRVEPTPTVFPKPYRPLAAGEWIDEWGCIWTNREFPRVSGHPLEAGWDSLSAYELPDPHAVGRYGGAEARFAQHEDRYRLGYVWFTLFERLWFLRGFDNMLMDPYVYPAEFAELRDRIIEFNVASIEEQLRLGVHGIFFSDDWGTQETLLMNPDDWRKWYKPQYIRMFDAVHQGGAHVLMHLCGSVMAIIPDLIEMGLDVLNPVQPQAMDVDTLASRFGGQVCFNGGADVQGTLPHGTPRDVEREVKHLIDSFGRYSGGYIGGTSHTILPDTPAENVVALFRAFRDYSGWHSTQKS